MRTHSETVCGVHLRLCCYSVLTVLWCYSGETLELQWCYSGVTAVLKLR
jgi:hypothetical protein